MIEFKPRFFVMPAIAVAVLAMLYVPADGGHSHGLCGPAVNIADPGIRESFVAMQQRQSTAAREICAVHANNLR